MWKKIFLWTLAAIITLATAKYQKLTGPTHEALGKATIGGAAYKYELPRSHPGLTDAPIEISVSDMPVTGLLIYKRYKLNEAWTEIPMQRQGDKLIAHLPHQPPAGKLEYYLRLFHGEQVIAVPADQSLVIRFRGAVPAWAMLPHILLMFLAMLLAARVGLEALSAQCNVRKLTYWTAGILFVGGLIFGPIVQHYAFGAAWTGAPFGWDLTDNKTLIAMLGWLPALIAIWRHKSARGWVIFAALLLLITFSIPHSMMGSELDYQTGQVGTAGAP